LIGCQHFWVAQLLRRHIGPQHQAGFALLALLQRCLSRTHLPWDLPRERLDGRGGWGTPFASVTFVFAQVIDVKLGRLPRLRERLQSLVGRRGRLKTLRLHVKEWLVDCLICALLRFGDGGLGPLKGGIRRHHQPPLGPAIMASL
jgi:hypothetical protein